MGTNDTTQLEQGINSLALRIYENYLGRGYTEKAAKRETVASLIEVIKSFVVLGNPNDVAYILEPLTPVAVLMLSSRIGDLSSEYAVYVADGKRDEGQDLFEEGKRLNTARMVLKQMRPL